MCKSRTQFEAAGCRCAGRCGRGQNAARVIGFANGTQPIQLLDLAAEQPDQVVADAVKCALGIVDPENDFTSASRGAKLPVDGGELIAPNVARLMASSMFCFKWASKDWHPFDMFNFAEVCGQPGYTSQIADEDGQMADVYPRHCVENTWGAQFIPGIDETKFDKVYKKGTSRTKDSYSATGNPDLVRDLRARGITRVYLGGIVTRICVGLTALALLDEGFEVYIIEDASRDLPIAANFQYVLDALRKHPRCKFVNTDDVIGAAA